MVLICPDIEGEMNMGNLKHILAATDQSQNSLHAVARAFLIAGKCGARLTLIYALGLDSMKLLRKLLGENVDEVSRKITEEAHAKLVQISSMSAYNQGIVADLQLEQDTAGIAIPAFADKNNVDLLVIGAHGKDFIQYILLGSTASRLIRKSKDPVLVVRQPPAGDYARVLVAIDFSPVSENLIRIALEVAPAATIILTHVFEVPFESKMHYAGVSEAIINQYRIEAQEIATSRLHELAAATGLTNTNYKVEVLHGDVTRQTIHLEQHHKCDLIVMGKHGTHVTEELLLGSITNHILAESNSDVLVVGDKRRPVINMDAE